MLKLRNRGLLSNDWFDDFFGRSETPSVTMKTDIKKENGNYLFEVELPGVKKENLELTLHEGYLTIEAKVTETKNEDTDSHYIRGERFYGSYARRFYVGEGITDDEINAVYEDGILTVTVPDAEAKPENQPKQITIH